jgi:mannose-6-phosphate isomerase-like protein (cupin superfamily)
MGKIFLMITAFTLMAGTRQVIDLYTPIELTKMKQELANQNGRFVGRDLQRYGNHYTMFAYRSATGSSEIHQHEADIFFIEDGDATIVTGGKMVGGKMQKPGELRGTSIEGGDKRPLQTGDIIHIPAGVPHQILVTPGKPITYFVVKVSGQ